MVKVAIISGKGGVGKTTFSLSLAKQLSEQHRIALAEIDISSHNLSDSFKETEGGFEIEDDTIVPATYNDNLEYVYYHSGPGQITWYGKDYADVSHQLIHRTSWSGYDYMIIDCPPGTGEDVQRILPQTDAVIVILQPHRYSVSNAKRVVELCRDLKVPVAGLIVNFAYLDCECGRRHHIFNEIDKVHELGLPILQTIPVTVDDYVTIDVSSIAAGIKNPVTLKKKKSTTKSLLKGVLKNL